MTGAPLGGLGRARHPASLPHPALFVVRRNVVDLHGRGQEVLVVLTPHPDEVRDHPEGYPRAQDPRGYLQRSPYAHVLPLSEGPNFSSITSLYSLKESWYTKAMYAIMTAAVTIRDSTLKVYLSVLALLAATESFTACRSTMPASIIFWNCCFSAEEIGNSETGRGRAASPPAAPPACRLRTYVLTKSVAKRSTRMKTASTSWPRRLC